MRRLDVDASAVVDGSLRVTGTAGDPMLAGEVALVAPRFASAQLGSADAQFTYGRRRLSGSLQAHDGARRILVGQGIVPLDLTFADGVDRLLDEPLDFAIEAESFPAATLLGLLEGFSASQGVLDGRIELRGTTREPAFSGTLALTGGATTWEPTGVRYRDVNGVVETQGGRVIGVDAVGRTVDPRSRAATGRGGALPPGGPGVARVTGSIDFEQIDDPRFALLLRGDELLASRRRDADLTITGSANLRGRYSRPLVGGSIRVDRGAL
jgi:autotransporter translocation and assembly factor TamB